MFKWLKINRGVGAFIVPVLLAGLLQAVTVATPIIPASSANAATSVPCSSTMAQQNALKAAPSHGQVFYIDSGVTPKNDAAYAAYRISNASTNVRNVWVALQNFSGGKVTLANPSDEFQQVSVPASGAATVFFLLKASGSSLTPQTHTVNIFDKRPDLIGASTLLSCDFSFVKVAETIKASSNKIDGGITGSLSPSTAVLGGTYTVTISSGSGNNTTSTGKVGSGSAPDYKAFWASPAAFSNWPTRALRLESTSIAIDNNGSGTCLTVTDQLFINSAIDTAGCLGNSTTWHATYVFRIIGPGPSALAPQPVAIISSGTQYKHSPYVAAASNTSVDLSNVVAANSNATISLDSRVVATTSSSATILYTATIRTTASSAVRVDEMVATNQAGMTYLTGTSRQGTTAATMAAVSDPAYMAADANLSPPPYHYVGPFSVDYRTNYLVTYRFSVPCTATLSTYSANVVAYIGDVMIGSGQNTVGTANVQTQSSGGSCTAQVTNTTTTMAPTVITSPADSISSSAATVYGQFNANNNTSVDYRWSYATDPNLVNGVVTTSWTTISGGAVQSLSARLSGLSQLTTYYFRAQIRQASGTPTNGEILSFTTSATQYTPTVDTRAASRISSSSVTLNGMVNPNLTQISGVYFGLCSNQAMTTGCSTITVRTDNGSGTAVALTFAANSSGDFLINSDNIDGTQQIVSGLTSGNTYYFRASVTCTDVVYCASGAVFGPVLKFTAGSPSAATDGASYVADSGATLNGTFNANGASATANTQFCYGTSPAATAGVLTSCTTISGDVRSVTGTSDLTSSVRVIGLTPGTTYYYQAIARSSTSYAVAAYGSVSSFVTLKINTASVPSGAIGAAYQASLEGMGGSTSYDWSTDSRLPNGLTLASNGLISGTPTESGIFTIVVKMIDLASGQYTTASYTLSITATVTFHSNYVGGASDTTQSAATATALTANGFSRPGYGFAGWATTANGTKAYDDQASYAFSSNGDLYALWSPVNYVVSYNLNSGTGTNTSPASRAYNSTFSLPVTSDVSRTGYSFGGWLYNSVTYSGGASFTMPGNDVTLTARWTVNNYNVAFTLNGGTGTTTTTTSRAYNTTFNLPLTSDVNRPGYSFTGWLYNSVTYSGGASFTLPASDVTFSAQWTPVNYTASFALNGGSGTNTSPASYAYNSSFNLPTTADVSRTGYNFAGWLYNSVTYSGGASFTMPGNDVTFTARWTANSYSTSVSTDPVTSLTFKSAVLNGTISAGAAGLANSSVTSLYLCYSSSQHIDASNKLDTGVTCSTRVDLWSTSSIAANGTKAVSVSVGGLTPEATYYSQIQLGFANGVFLYGAVEPFTVLPRPGAVTDAAIKVTSKGATIRGSVNPKKNRLSKVAFCWGTDPLLTSCSHNDDTSLQSWWTDAVTNSDQSVSANLSGLNPHTTYYYQVYTIADDGGITTMKFVKRSIAGSTAQGSIQSFTTAWAETTAVTNVNQSSAILHGTFHAGSTDIAHADVTGVYLCYSTSNSLDQTTGRLSVSPVCSSSLWGASDAIGAGTTLS